MQRIFLLIILFVVCSATPMQAQPQGSNPDSDRNPQESQKKMDLLWGVKIPMRDGVHLNATIYRPHEVGNPLPVLFELTPYPSAPWDDVPFYFARHGYVFVVVDSRGRGNSEGTFKPFFQEPQDGRV